MIRKTIKLNLPRPLTRQACADLATVTNRFESRIMLESNSRIVNGKSMLGLMTLSLSDNDVMIAEVEGPDEREALAAIEGFTFTA